MQRVLCGYGREECEKDRGVYQASVGGGQGRRTTDDGEFLRNPFTGSKQQVFAADRSYLRDVTRKLVTKGFARLRKSPGFAGGSLINAGTALEAPHREK